MAQEPEEPDRPTELILAAAEARDLAADARDTQAALDEMAIRLSNYMNGHDDSELIEAAKDARLRAEDDRIEAAFDRAELARGHDISPEPNPD